MRKWRERERERKWRENQKMQRVNLSPFPLHFLILSQVVTPWLSLSIQLLLCRLKFPHQCFQFLAILCSSSSRVHFTPLRHSVGVQSFDTSIASRLVSLLTYRYGPQTFSRVIYNRNALQHMHVCIFSCQFVSDSCGFNASVKAGRWCSLPIWGADASWLPVGQFEPLTFIFSEMG